MRVKHRPAGRPPYYKSCGTSNVIAWYNFATGSDQVLFSSLIIEARGIMFQSWETFIAIVIALAIILPFILKKYY